MLVETVQSENCSIIHGSVMFIATSVFSLVGVVRIEEIKHFNYVISFGRFR